MDETNQWKFSRSFNIPEAPPRTSDVIGALYSTFAYVIFKIPIAQYLY